MYSRPDRRLHGHQRLRTQLSKYFEDVRYTSLTATISHDNNNHRRSKHASKSWRSGGSPSCLGGSSHVWVPVRTHSTLVPTSVRRLWVAHQLHHTTMSQRKLNMVAEQVLCDLSVSSKVLRDLSVCRASVCCRLS